MRRKISVMLIIAKRKSLDSTQTKMRKELKKGKKRIISSHTSVTRVAIARWNYILQLYSYHTFIKPIQSIDSDKITLCS